MFTRLRDMANNYGKQDLHVMGINDVDFPELQARFYNSMQKSDKTIQSYDQEQIDEWWNEIKILLFIMSQREHKKLAGLTQEKRRGQLVAWYARALLEVVDYNKTAKIGK